VWHEGSPSSSVTPASARRSRCTGHGALAVLVTSTTDGRGAGFNATHQEEGDMTAMSPAQLTRDVLAAYSGTPGPRLRELLAALIGHLHEFAVQTRLTPAEWLTGIQFLTAVGQACTP